MFIICRGNEWGLSDAGYQPFSILFQMNTGVSDTAGKSIIGSTGFARSVFNRDFGSGKPQGSAFDAQLQALVRLEHTREVILTCITSFQEFSGAIGEIPINRPKSSQSLRIASLKDLNIGGTDFANRLFVLSFTSDSK